MSRTRVCELETAERATGLDCSDCGRADFERKMFFKSEIKEQKKGHPQ